MCKFTIPLQLSARRHGERLFKKILKKNVRKFRFSDRVIDKWNVLLEVVSAQNTHTFKEKYESIL